MNALCKEETKMIYVAINTKNVEIAYVEANIFAKLMSKGFIRWDGFWIQQPWAWGVFFAGLSNGRVK